MVFYFTGTGNSQYIARRLSKSLGDEIFSINNSIKKSQYYKNTAEDLLVFSLPTYAWRIPRIVEEWIIESTFSQGARVYFVMNCGGEIGNAEKYLKKLCCKKDLVFMGCGEIVMPENYLAMFSTPTPEQGKKIISRAEPVIDEIAEHIKAGIPLPPRKPGFTGKIMSSIVNIFFYPVFVKANKFTVNPSLCIGCDLCARKCPLNNIQLTGNKPVWGKKCTHCMACISICPKQAIEYGKSSINRAKYRCPYEN